MGSRMRTYFSEQPVRFLTTTFYDWKDRFDDYALRDVRSVHSKINYIHLNPVRKGLVARAEVYLYSSAALYLNQVEEKIKVTHFIDALGP